MGLTQLLNQRPGACERCVLFDIRFREQTWTRSRETGSTVKLSSTTGPSGQSFPQDVPLPEQGAQTTGHTAHAPRCPRGDDAVH